MAPPSIHDKGTHYSTNHRLTLELLYELSEPEDVVGITGYYTGNFAGAEMLIQSRNCF